MTSTKRIGNGHYRHLQTGYNILRVRQPGESRPEWQLHNTSYPDCDSWCQTFATRRQALAAADAIGQADRATQKLQDGAWAAIVNAYGDWIVIGTHASLEDAVWAIQVHTGSDCRPQGEGPDALYYSLDGRHLICRTSDLGILGYKPCRTCGRRHDDITWGSYGTLCNACSLARSTAWANNL
jgi:hypothetical protein